MTSMKENKILALAIPAMIENVLQTAVGFIDALMISKIGLVAVTAVGIANTILNVYLALFIALGVGASALIAQKIGAKQPDEAQKVTNQAVMLTLAVSLLLGIISIVFGESLLRVMGASEAVLQEALQFFMVVGGGALFMGLMTIFGSILRATGDTKSPMKISVVVNIGNVVIDYILIFGLGPIPALGVLGTAIGTVLSRGLGCWLLYRKVQQSESPVDHASLFNSGNYRPLVNLSIPATLERLVMRLGQVLYFGLIVSISAKTFAAHSIAGNIESFTYMPAYGLATAATTLVGNAIGAGESQQAKRYGYLAAKYGVIFMSLLGVVLFFGAPFFASLFTSDQEALRQIVIALRIDAFAQPGLAISLITTGALQGMGDTKSPLYSTAFGMWGIRVVGVIVLSKYLGLGIAGIWLSIAIDLYLRSLFLVYKFNHNLSDKRIIAKEPSE
ncbi:MATE family efflux transporter [Enterococcus hulanensis]|uniref:Probable multidrug resistance protein NorM n=1 Tax=Enterococcus hulanensis TaxID=2559929 RepID=A0ABU3EV54_9ENTE|nr:MATE family efflux transporter [Enterococcus hulanensis]MDT2598750.1 MATE family efflux transporter [Enterococcus hulanensis]MDT2607746.1 MATE family efflux transporter [Enterococcus hulanensis]MDT2615041.1 MATE family efflux transporter [Enterococcus hulanensis]MDT2626989.1 MATE family efflux transporter [Enterococcus hulanensis]MDT2654111.1 MATE family efflux transporter [Enterococcus hulanensis]